MRVAYLINQYPKVSHTFVRREMQALEARGVDVVRVSIRDMRADVTAHSDDDDRRELSRTHVLLGADKRGTAAALVAALASAATTPSRLKDATALAVRLARQADRKAVHAAYLLEAARLKTLCDRERVDHVHAHFGTNSATVAALCAALGGPPFSFTAHGPEEFDRPFELALGEKIARAAFVVGVSSFGRSQLLRHTPAAQWDKVKVVPCGVDDAFLAATHVTPPPAAHQLVCVGRLCEQKGQLLLVDAVAAARPRLAAQGVADLRVTLVGDGELRGVVEARARETGVDDVISVTGWASGAEVRAALQGARALVLPSFAEGLPVVIMESLALERPVISTYVAGIPELVDAACGWLVPAGAVAPLADAIVDAVTADVTVLAAKGAVGRARVVARHDAKIAAAMLEAHFAAAASTRSPR